MKKGLLFLLLANSFFANAQSLKEALYSGKLKNDPGTVIRKGDDLASKMDTATRKPQVKDSMMAKATIDLVDSSSKVVMQTNGATTTTDKNTNTETATTETTTENTAPPAEAAPAAKDNNALWKDYVTSVTNALKTEVMPSKKVKNGTYYVSITYVIGTDGQITINNVLLTPENSFLQQQIKDRFAIDTPKMTPVLSSSGAPRKVNKNFNFTLTK